MPTCLLCQQDKFRPLDSQKLVWQCANCTLAYQRKPPADPGKLYTRQEYDNYQSSQGRARAFERFYHDVDVAHQRMTQLKEILKTSMTTADTNRWLDIGCGNGAFLTVARQHGFDAVGIELHESYCEELARHVQLRVFTPEILMEAAMSAEVISLFDVIEHFIDPIGVLLHAVRILTVGGLLVIETPNLDRCKNFNSWKHFRPDEHLTYWTQLAWTTLRQKLFSQCQLIHESEPVPDHMQFVWRKSEKSKSKLFSTNLWNE